MREEKSRDDISLFQLQLMVYGPAMTIHTSKCLKGDGSPLPLIIGYAPVQHRH